MLERLCDVREAMRAGWEYAKGVAWLFGVAAIVLVTVSLAQAASTEMKVGTGLLCDTQQQVEQFMVLSKDMPIPAALAKVNKDAGKAFSCSVERVAYIEGEKVGESYRDNKRYAIVQIMVLGGFVGSEFHRVTPTLQFTVFAIAETPA